MRQADVRQAAREKAMTAQRQHRRRRAERDRRVRRHAETVLVALGERDAVVAETECAAGMALLAMTREEGLTVLEAVACCGGGAFSRREATRLLRRAQQAQQAREAGVDSGTATAGSLANPAGVAGPGESLRPDNAASPRT